MDAKIYAERLRIAHLNKSAIDPLREEIGMSNLEFAYQIQDINTKIRQSNGARIIGKKIGLTSKAVQKQLGVDQPDFGILFSDMEVLNGLSISVKKLMQPKVEAEIAFVLAEDLDRNNLTIVDLIDCIDYVLPAIEIVGSRIKNWDIKITDTIADNASASHYIIGHSPKTLDEIDVVNCEVDLIVNDKIISTGKGSACLGSPLNATLWLAQKMFEIGRPLRAGELILSGALGPMSPIKAGDFVRAEFKNFGDVSVGFEA